MKKEQAQPLVLASPEPINDGGRKYNWIYLASAGVFLVLFILMGANFAGICMGPLIGLCIGWLIKNKILDIISTQLRYVEFDVKNKIPYSALTAELIPKLTPLGMTIEKSNDQNGHPVISYQNMIYDVSYSDGKDIFTIRWRKNIARALITVDSINMYRKITVAMGIIGYYIQQSCNSELTPSGNSLDKNIAEEKDQILTEKRFCVSCGSELKPDAKFCPKCGTKINRISKGENNGDEKTEFQGKVPQEKRNKKKRNLCIGAVVIVLGLLLISSTKGGVYSDVKAISFDDMGPETIGELIDKNVKGADWSQEKIDKDSRLVSVEGYCPLYSEDIRITFFYEKFDHGYREVSLQSVEFPESGEYFDDVFNVGIVWASFYE